MKNSQQDCMQRQFIKPEKNIVLLPASMMRSYHQELLPFIRMYLSYEANVKVKGARSCSNQTNNDSRYRATVTAISVSSENE